MDERETAVYSLIDIFDFEKFGSLALKSTLGNAPLTNIQKAFVTEVVNGVLRNIIFLDYVINKFSSVRTDKMKPFILNVIRISVYQIIFMDKIPASAACNEAVKLTKKKHFGKLSGFVNGVLRSISAGWKNIELPEDKIECLSVKYSCPLWIIRYWLEYFSYEQTEAICRNSATRPEISICVNTLKTDNEKLLEALRKENFNADFSGGFAFIKGSGSPAHLKAFKSGLFYMMDKSAQAAVDILDPQRGESIADVCAAPGGKSFYAAFKMHNEGRISARDIYEHRINLINEGRKRLGADIVSAELKDASISFEEDKNKFDKIIFDLPCSGLGLMRRKPDIKYRKTYDDILSLKELQLKIFSACSEYLKPGGIALYCTCTISPLENEKNVEFICRNFDYELCDIDIPKNLNCIKTEYGLQIITEKSDGFFISKLRRKRR